MSMGAAVSDILPESRRNQATAANAMIPLIIELMIILAVRCARSTSSLVMVVPPVPYACALGLDQTIDVHVFDVHRVLVEAEHLVRGDARHHERLRHHHLAQEPPTVIEY